MFCIMLCLSMVPIHSCVCTIICGEVVECGSQDLFGGGSGTIRKCGFLQNFITVGVGFGFPPSAKETLLLAPWKISLPNFLWIKMQNSHTLLLNYVCLHVYHAMRKMYQTSKILRWPQIKVCFYKSFIDYFIYFQ